MTNKMANFIFTSENVSFFSQCGDQTLRPYIAMMFGHFCVICFSLAGGVAVAICGLISTWR